MTFSASVGSNRAVSHRVHSAGFNLGELVTVMGISATLITVAVPVVGNVYMNARIKTVAADFASTLRYARAEAIARSLPVNIIPATAQGWRDGWRVKAGNRLLSDQAQPLRVEVAYAPDDGLTYTGRGTLARPTDHRIVFHAPDYRWVTPRCVHIRTDGRPIVEPVKSGQSPCAVR